MALIDVKLVRVALGLLILGALVAYTIEFAIDQKHSPYHQGHAGFIILYICILIIGLVGLYGVFVEKHILVAVFEVCYLVLVIIDGVYIGAVYAIVLGAITLVVGFLYVAETMGGVGK